MLHLPWLELAVLSPLIGAGAACFFKNAEKARIVAILFSGLALLLAIGAWEDFNTLRVFEAHVGGMSCHRSSVPTRWLLTNSTHR